jgi:hypothetical protein
LPTGSRDRNSHGSAASRLGLTALAIVCAGASLWLPETWYRPLPPVDPLPAPPVSGWFLLRVFLAIDALVLFVLAFRTPAWSPLPTDARIGQRESVGTARSAPPWLWLCIITVLGLVLRVIALDSDLWLDEVSPLLLYGDASPWQIVTSYISGNNHLLNTLLVKAVIAIAGESEWSVRVPAVLFGVASIPLLYAVARQGLGSTAAGLSASLLLATSYHHVFFSQNARGYTALVFFALAASALLARGLAQDRRRDWIAYIACVVLGMSSLLVFGFVLAGHALVGIAAVVAVRRRGGAAWPLARRMAVVFAAGTWLALHVYVVTLPGIYVYVRSTYVDPSVGFAPVSSELAREVLRALSTGYGRGALIALIPAAILGVAGVRRLFARNPLLLAALAAPLAVQFVVVAGLGLLILPRTFLHALPLALLVLTAAIESVVEWTGTALRRRGVRTGSSDVWTVAVTMVIAAAGAVALARYYQVPKQPYRAALAHAAALTRPDGVIVVAHNARGGALYYAPRLGPASERVRYAYEDADVAAAIADTGGRPVAIVTTFPRALRLDQPDLDRRLRDGWRIEREFAATINDGEVLIWIPK